MVVMMSVMMVTVTILVMMTIMIMGGDNANDKDSHNDDVDDAKFCHFDT